MSNSVQSKKNMAKSLKYCHFNILDLHMAYNCDKVIFEYHEINTKTMASTKRNAHGGGVECT